MEGAKGLKDKESGKCIGKYKQQWRHKKKFWGGFKKGGTMISNNNYK